MSNRILHHTWSIRIISPFAIPLFSSTNCSSRSVVEEQLSICARRFVEQHNLMDHHKEEESGTTTTTTTITPCDGTYVTLTWISLHRQQNLDKPASSTQKDDKLLPHSRKRSRSDSLDTKEERLEIQDQLHLLIEVRIADEPSAQIVLCFAQEDDAIKDNDNVNSRTAIVVEKPIQSFSFLLMRGSISILGGTVIPWLESTCGCTISSKPFCPTPQEVASTLALWTTTTMPNLTTSMEEQEEAKPLEITFSVPVSLESSGLQKMSFTIPPNSLQNLCRDIEKHRRPHSVAGNNDNKKALLERTEETSSQITTNTHHDGGSRKVTDMAKSIVHENGFVNDPNPLTTTARSSFPILAALQHYVLETFHLDIRTFPLVRASSSLAVLGCDGRCKPLDSSHLPVFLQTIERMIQVRIHPNESRSYHNNGDE